MWRLFVFLILCSCLSQTPERAESNNDETPQDNLGISETPKLPEYIDYDVNQLPEYDLNNEEITCNISSTQPNLLSEHCLFQYTRNNKAYKNFHYFDVKYPLWTDGAQKKRWLYIPPGKKIDTSNPDEWIYPVGTIIWKEFSYNGLIVETRIIEKRGVLKKYWRASVYVWQADQTDAEYDYYGEENVLGTDHDVPSVTTCINCHNGRSDFAIGPEAMQLEHRDKIGLNLDKLKILNLITNDLPRPMVIKTDKLSQKALGYLHGNCSHCHNPDSGWQGSAFGDPSTYNFRHTSKAQGLEFENAYIDLLRFNKINLNYPEQSNILNRMGNENFRMPPVGVEKTDTAGYNLMLEWIREEAKRN